ncbi:hypothetical protein [Thermococcus sp.]
MVNIKDDTFVWEGLFIKAYPIETTGLFKRRKHLRIEQKKHVITDYSEFKRILKKYGLSPTHGLYNAKDVDIYYARGPRGGNTIWYRLKTQDLVERLTKIDNELLLRRDPP